VLVNAERRHHYARGLEGDFNPDGVEIPEDVREMLLPVIESDDESDEKKGSEAYEIGEEGEDDDTEKAGKDGRKKSPPDANESLKKYFSSIAMTPGSDATREKNLLERFRQDVRATLLDDTFQSVVKKAVRTQAKIATAKARAQDGDKQGDGRSAPASAETPRSTREPASTKGKGKGRVNDGGRDAVSATDQRQPSESRTKRGIDQVERDEGAHAAKHVC
jgi:hypothetical protein